MRKCSKKEFLFLQLTSKFWIYSSLNIFIDGLLNTLHVLFSISKDTLISRFRNYSIATGRPFQHRPLHKSTFNSRQQNTRKSHNRIWVVDIVPKVVSKLNDRWPATPVEYSELPFTAIIICHLSNMQRSVLHLRFGFQVLNHLVTGWRVG